MTKIGWIIFVFGICGLGFGILGWWYSQTPVAILKIDTTPSSVVFINNKQLGQTPAKERVPAGEVNLRLIPTASSSAMPTYQAKIFLHPKVVTVINRNFGISEAESSGSTIVPEKISGNGTRLAVVTSVPDLASVSVDGKPLGFTPLNTTEISLGDHQLTISAPGFVDKKIALKTEKGYQLNVSAKLAVLPVLPSPTPTVFVSTASASLGGQTVLVGNTPTGFLRVRSGPGINYSELGQVKPKEKYPLLDKVTGWYLIKVDIGATSSGWISSQWSQIQNSNDNNSPNTN